ncbi:MAG: hypothetical protein H0W76_28260, partial [Pyrinomonadaceae bacterium]|nr:hypothetical protein [Pyrinomonadaceae bacterium]
LASTTPTNTTVAQQGWLVNMRAQTQEQERIPPVIIRGGLPDTLPLTTDQKYDYYASVARSRNAMQETPVGHRTIIGFRVITPTNADSTDRAAGMGVYDDMVVMIWKERDRAGNEVKRVKHFTANTEPSAQYDQALMGTRKENGLTIGRKHAEGRDPDGDGRRDLGRLPDGKYTYERSSSATLGTIGRRILRPVTENDSGIMVDRDVNHDGSFNDVDSQQIAEYKARLIRSGRTEAQAQAIINRELNSQETIYFHRGGAITRDRNDNITAQDTYSAACQTFPGREKFDEFWDTLGEEQVTGQRTFEYVLVTLPQ